MNGIDIIIIVAGIILLFLFVLLKLTKVPIPVYKSRVIYSDHREKLEKPIIWQNIRRIYYQTNYFIHKYFFRGFLKPIIKFTSFIFEQSELKCSLENNSIIIRFKCF